MTQAVSIAQSGSNNTTFRNRIINGNMMIDQRNAGASVTPTTTAYTLDRWQLTVSQASKLSIQRSSIAPAGFSNSIAITSLSSYSTTASDFFDVRQAIEGYNIADFGFGTVGAASVTLSFWVRSSLTGTFGGSLKADSGTRSYPFTYTINAANTWEWKTVAVSGDTTGTWLTGNNYGMGVIFSLGTGSTYSGTANAWASANYNSATGATSVVGTSGATFYITGVQLEKGTTATPFEQRLYGTELALCQRYAYFVGAFMATHYTPTSTVYAGIPFTMRATPSVTMLGTLQMNNMIGNNLNLNGANFERGNQGGASIYLSYTGSSGASSAQACVVRPSSADAYSGVLFTAEL